MKAYEAFDIDINKNELICLVGAGGKTTTSFLLARELKAIGKKVLIATSTAIYYPREEDVDNVIITDKEQWESKMEEIKKGSITVIGRLISEEDKLIGIEKELIDKIYEERLFDVIIVEADGAKRKPIKAPAKHEPVIPYNATKAIGVIGLDSIGNRIMTKNVHRAENFCRVTKSKWLERINEEIIFRLVVSEDGLFKGVPKNCRRYLLLNKVDGKGRKKAGLMICNLIRNSKFKLNGALIASVRAGIFYKDFIE